MAVIRTWYEPYSLDRCPHCGATLDAPDDNLDRRCPTCRYTVGPAKCELHDARR